jgi:hypothetical protein
LQSHLPSCLLFLAVDCPAGAAPEGPLYTYFPDADTIYDVRVASVEKEKLTFSVVEVGFNQNDAIRHVENSADDLKTAILLGV